MAGKGKPVEPKTFFLNEHHELDPTEKSGGGGVPKYEGISWASRGQRIEASLKTVEKALSASKDPVRASRYYVMAQPVLRLDKRKETRAGALIEIVPETTDFGGDHARVFGRLGLDLIQVTDDGKAIVHAEKDRFTQLVDKAAILNTLGPREQSRWATIDRFEGIPVELRIDGDWLSSIRTDDAPDVIIELQPLLLRIEVEDVLRAISELLLQRKAEKLTGTGTDFSGRHWFRGKASRKSLREIARDFFSVQSLHPPLFSTAAASGFGSGGGHQSKAVVTDLVDVSSLPCVAVVDLGVPVNHKQLARYRRGQFISQHAARPPVGSHGSAVASRVVYGDQPSDKDLERTMGSCRFYDVMVGDYPDGSESHRVADKAVLDALTGVQSAAPDVRVFNLSFGDHRPLHAIRHPERREKYLDLQDLDNFILRNDVIVVVAAGNSHPGVPPAATTYPGHVDDPGWALGPWASGFNTLVCGAYVGRASSLGGLANVVGWPSPFSRIGPGLCGAPIPGFGAPGGDWNTNYRWSAGLGVWGFGDTGLPEDRSGTSHAAPILAREAAFTLEQLQKHCAPNGYPFAVTAKAFLALTATREDQGERVSVLADRTLGRGRASGVRLSAPVAKTAVMLWQGVIGSASEEVAIQVPIPRDWLQEASEPRLRFVAAWDVPVSEAARSRWACRELTIRLRPGPEARAIRASGRGKDRHPTYPLRECVYDLRKATEERTLDGDLWLIEMSYEQKADYPAGMDVDPSQRIALAIELSDDDPTPVSPQAAFQSLPVAAFMSQLSVPPVAVRSPVIIRTRG